MATRENPFFSIHARSTTYINVVNTGTWDLTTPVILLSIITVDLSCVMLLNVLKCQLYVSGTKSKMVHLDIQHVRLHPFKKMFAKECQFWADGTSCTTVCGVFEVPIIFRYFCPDIGWAVWACLAEYNRAQRCGINCDPFTQSQFLVTDLFAHVYVANETQFGTF